MFSSLGSHLDFTEYILMALYYKVIRNLLVVSSLALSSH